MNYLNWLTLTTTILVGATPSLAASEKITAIELENSKQRLELQLETEQVSKQLPSFVTVDNGKTLEATIFDAELNFNQKESFQKLNPAPGISEISLTKVGEDHTKIKVIKDSDLVLKPTLKLEDSDLIISFATENNKNYFLQKLPFSNQIKSLKNSVASLIDKSRAKDNSKEKSPVIIAQNTDQDILVPNPEITISNNHGGATTQKAYEDTYLPRAVAPPVGDLAVSNISTFPDTVDLGSRAIVPRMVLRDAPVREVLSLLSRQAGLNIVFAVEEEEGRRRRRDDDDEVVGPTVSLDLENQSVQEVFDSVLLISDLTASRRGNIIYVGRRLPAQARNLISRTIRLNQVRAENAALFLASQGATGQRLTTEVEETVDPETGRVVQRRELPASLEDLGGPGENEDSNTRALLLRGLQVATDDRLNSITLVGEVRKVETATTFLTQLDARRRQVAVNLKIIDVNLLNQDFFNSSFSFGVNDSFFIQDQGAATLRFGDSSPAGAADLATAQSRVSAAPVIANPFAESETFINFDGSTAIPGTSAGLFDQGTGQFNPPNTSANFFNRQAAVSNDPRSAGITDFTLAEAGTINNEGAVSFGTEGTATSSLPSFFEFPRRFLALLESSITSGNAKILTDPTVVVQEGQESTVRLTQDIIRGVNTNISDNGVTTSEPLFGEAGLSVTVNVERIDDNGFVSLSVSPVVSSIASTQNFDSGGGAVNLISLLSRREVSSGLIRLRDGQTLILSGIIQDEEREATTKVPILGDLPLLGSLFRNTTKTNERAEVIVLLTPEIIDEQSNFGYNYQPSDDSRELLRRGGLNLPNTPQ